MPCLVPEGCMTLRREESATWMTISVLFFFPCWRQTSFSRNRLSEVIAVPSVRS